MDPKSVANILAAHFAQVSASDAYPPTFTRLKEAQESLPLSFHLSSPSPLDEPFTFNELESSLSSTSNSAPGSDGIHYAMLRNLPPDATLSLLHLFNRVYSERVFPSSWSKSVVVALHKVGQDKLLPASYRPISLTSCVCKVMEKMVNRRLVWFLESNNLLAKEQCGFRQSRSTTDHLVTLQTAVLDAFVQRKQVLGVFFDIKKAYDTAWRRGVLNTLSSWGVGGNLLAFTAGFLNDRSFQVRLGTTLSDPFEQENGVPQGSVYSCTLFNIAINGIASCAQLPAC